jgi:hypothetical protein
MDYVVCNKSDLDAIANSIRLKTGKADLISVDTFIDELCFVQTFDDIIDGSVTEFSNLNLTEISNGMFYNCHSLTKVYLPNVKKINSMAFCGCEMLKEADFPLTTKLDGSAFEGCTSLENINFPLVTSLYSDCFYRCTSLTSVNFPSVTSIGLNIFTDCSSLRKCVLPLVTSISYGAFSKCINLEALILSNAETVVSLGNNVFDNSSIENGTGYIYVPSVLMEDYKIATNWSSYAGQFRAIEDYSDILA